jgi:hypothetical protein
MKSPSMIRRMPANLVARVEARILLLRGQRVMLDADLAALYGVSTRVLNPAVKQTGNAFPEASCSA